MISFTENPEAFCLWAKSQKPPAEGLALLAKVLRCGEWRAAPLQWVHHLSWPQFWQAETVSLAIQIRSELISTIRCGELDAAAHAALPGIFNTRSLAPIAEASKIAAWVVEKADPNDATMIGDVVQHVVWSRQPALARDCYPLIDWLLMKGSSELRSNRRSQLVAQLVPVVAEFGSSDQLMIVIRYVLYNEHRVRADGWGHQTIEKLAAAIERVLGTGASGSLIGDVASALEPQAVDVYVDRVLRSPEVFRRSRSELLKRLARGEFESSDGIGTWALAFAGGPEALEVLDADTARALGAGLIRGVGVPDAPLHADRVVWGRTVGSAILTGTRLLSTRMSSDVDLLQRCAGLGEDFAQGIHEAVAAAVKDLDDLSLKDVNAILTAPRTSPGVVVAALEVLKRVALGRPRGPSTSSINHVLDAISRAVLADGPVVCGFNFRNAIGNVRSVRVGQLAQERAFLLDDNALLLSEDGVRRVCEVTDDRDAQQALGVMYAVHEVVHDFQGIAEKGEVARIRFAGAESALMHLDLGADHIAASVAHAIFPDWSLCWLKDWAGKSIPAFPAGTRHAPFSRIRKTLRFAGLRVDLALRKLGIGNEHLGREGYGFADFGPGGGTFAVMVNRPPFVVISTNEISVAQSTAFFEVIEGNSDAIADVDSIIHRVLTAP